MTINHPSTANVARVEAAEKQLRTLIQQDRAEGKVGPHLVDVYIPRAYEGVQEMQTLCYGLAFRSGWWSSRLTGMPLDYTQVNIGEKLMLIVSEVAEAMEGHRKDLMDDKLPHRKMVEVELADALIRICDLAGFLGLDLAGATIEKLAFNQQRPDHKIENRNAPGGKAY
jgi:NTP pyrophosphatase (non-canonical NTP hydrolase)